MHVIRYIAYNKGCVEKVLSDLKQWDNKELMKACLLEIADVHVRYQDFAAMTQSAVIEKIRDNFKDLFGSNSSQV